MSDERWRVHAMFAAVANGGLTGLWWTTRDRTPLPGDEGPGYYWPLWVALLWGLAVLLHYLHASGRLSPPAPATGPITPPEPESPVARTPDGPNGSKGPDDPAARRLERLTAREREILTLVAGGHSNQEIARRLVISERTARTHVSSVLHKLELPSRTQAALVAVRAGVAAP